MLEKMFQLGRFGDKEEQVDIWFDAEEEQVDDDEEREVEQKDSRQEEEEGNVEVEDEDDFVYSNGAVFNDEEEQDVDDLVMRMLAGVKGIIDSNEDAGSFGEEMDGEVENMVSNSDVMEELEDVGEDQGEGRMVRGGLLFNDNEGLEKGSARVEILKKERIELSADLRKEEVEDDVNEQGDEGLLKKSFGWK